MAGGRFLVEGLPCWRLGMMGIGCRHIREKPEKAEGAPLWELRRSVFLRSWLCSEGLPRSAVMNRQQILVRHSKIKLGVSAEAKMKPMVRCYYRSDPREARSSFCEAQITDQLSKIDELGVCRKWKVSLLSYLFVDVASRAGTSSAVAPASLLR